MKKQSSKKNLLVSVDRVRTLTTEELKTTNGGRCIGTENNGSDRCLATEQRVG